MSILWLKNAKPMVGQRKIIFEPSEKNRYHFFGEGGSHLPGERDLWYLDTGVSTVSRGLSSDTVFETCEKLVTKKL